ncbi:hypothetical protein D3C77_698400 [compost metagenome]
MTLTVVRDQWRRVIFMQTNREDVGKRFLEIEIPVPNNPDVGFKVSNEFRKYYQALSAARGGLTDYLRVNGKHHFYVSGAEAELVVSEESEV